MYRNRALGIFPVDLLAEADNVARLDRDIFLLLLFDLVAVRNCKLSRNRLGPNPSFSLWLFQCKQYLHSQPFVTKFAQECSLLVHDRDNFLTDLATKEPLLHHLAIPRCNRLVPIILVR